MIDKLAVMYRDSRVGALMAHGLILLVVVLVFWPLDLDYAFYYSDAPRHALNGAFILDLVKAFPIHDPVQWAYDYYAQYPALTILFYPPLYPAVLAIFYAVFGISQATAVLVNALFLIALASGVMSLARRYVGPMAALAAGVAAAVSPEIVFWARQIMTDVPAVAAAVWASVLLLRYLEDDRPRWLFGATLMLLAAIWLKITLCFMAPVLAAVLLGSERTRIWRRRRNAVALGLAVAGVLPLVGLTLLFGQTNVSSVASVPDAQASRLSLTNWLWYARQVPSQLGWPLALAAAGGVGLGLARLWRVPRFDGPGLLLTVWLIVGYLFFSAIALKSSRFSLPILPPLIVLAMMFMTWLPGLRRAGLAGLLAGVVALTLAWTLVARPPLQVAGYGRIARDIAQEAPPETNVVFSGYRDGAFVFAMRAIGDRPDLNIVRADKLLLNVAIRREAGVTQHDLSREQIADQLTRIKAAYVVAQDDFWNDLAVMRRLTDVLQSSQFERVAHYRLAANFPADDQAITVYRNRAALPEKRPPLSIMLPAIDREVSGK